MIRVNTYVVDEKTSTNASAPSVVFESDVEGVEELKITIVSTSDRKLPPTGVRLSIMACIVNDHLFTKDDVQSSEEKSKNKFTILILILTLFRRHKTSDNASQCFNNGHYGEQNEWYENNNFKSYRNHAGYKSPCLRR